MRKSALTCLIAAIAALLVVPLPLSAQSKRVSRYVLTFNSFGPVKVGMTVPAASKALGVRLTKDAGYDGDCYYVSPGHGFKDVSFMVNDERIARIDIWGGRYTTDRGARIGDSEARIKALYKDAVKVSQHPYVDYGHYLEVEMKGADYSIIFETDGKRVTSFRAGRYPAVGYIEGCS